jgi:hypothetical protein
MLLTKPDHESRDSLHVMRTPQVWLLENGCAARMTADEVRSGKRILVAMYSYWLSRTFGAEPQFRGHL